MGTTTWYYVCRAITGPSRVTAQAARKFLTGKGTLPAAADGYVYLTSITIELVDRRPVLITREEYSRHRVDAAGRWDDAHRAQLRRAAVELLDLPAHTYPSIYPGNWVPTDAEAAALVQHLLACGVPRYTPSGFVN